MVGEDEPKTELPLGSVDASQGRCFQMQTAAFDMDQEEKMALLERVSAYVGSGPAIAAGTCASR